MSSGKLWQKVTLWRQIVQWAFFAWCLFIGVQFALFVRYYQSGGEGAYYPRPPGVEGFLPIGALVSLKAFVTSGYFDPVHPAALVLFLTFVIMALVTRKSFCSWLCPVGTLEEGLWKVGGKLFGRNFRVWTWLDFLLRFCKYALLLFFAKLILLDMPVMALRGFLQAPYWALADVKMLHFFTDLSLLSLSIIGGLALLSLVYRNFWCRYLCPYGALLGLFSFFSPLRIVRNQASCTDCGACSRACPARIDVQRKTAVCSVECTGCLTCVERCPQADTLAVGFWRRPLPSWVFTLVVIGVFSGGVLLGMLSGHWETRLTHADYLRLIPLADKLGH